MGTINVSGIRCYSYHGCHEEEARIGGAYVVDIKIETDFEGAAMTDDLTQTIDYVEVYEIVKQQMAIRSKLIEHVAKRICNALLNQIKSIQHVEVKLTKLHPPIVGDVELVSVIYLGDNLDDKS